MNDVSKQAFSTSYNFPPSPSPPVRKLSLLLSLPLCRRSSLLREKGWVRSQLIRRRESLALSKSFNTLWVHISHKHHCSASQHVQLFNDDISIFFSSSVIFPPRSAYGITYKPEANCVAKEVQFREKLPASSPAKYWDWHPLEGGGGEILQVSDKSHD